MILDEVGTACAFRTCKFLFKSYWTDTEEIGFHYNNWNIDLGKWKIIKTFDPTVGNIHANPI